MIYLLFSIVASTLIFLIFKLFARFKINTLQAIVVNYIFACITGIVSYEASINITEIIHAPWFLGAIALGFLFISIFNVMALTAQRNGLSVASVASKMSVIIPVIFGLWAYNESVGLQKIIGIALALLAVYLTSMKSGSEINLKKGLMLPVLLFFGSGIIDTSIKYLETTYVASNGIPVFSATIFFFAACIGLSILSIKRIRGTFKFDVKSIFGGIVLGVVNYFSIFLLLKALQFEGLESSVIFTVNNVAIVMASTLIGLLFFKEKLDIKNWLGIALAILSIALVTLS